MHIDSEFVCPHWMAQTNLIGWIDGTAHAASLAYCDFAFLRLLYLELGIQKKSTHGTVAPTHTQSTEDISRLNALDNNDRLMRVLMETLDILKNNVQIAIPQYYLLINCNIKLYSIGYTLQNYRQRLLLS